MRVIVLLCALLAAVCAAACTSTPLPTLTLIPSDTPTVTDTPDPLTPAPTGTPVVLPTLPPTWTQPPVVTQERTTPPPTATFTPTVDPNTTLIAQPTLPACAPFSIDFARSVTTFTVGSDPQVYWNGVTDALNYRVSLRNDRSELLFTALIGATAFTFDGELFEAGRNYSWDVRPLDVRGTQMCLSRGAVLTPTVG